MSDIPRETLEHYATGYDAGRLTQGSGRIELARTQELVRRHLPAPPAVVCDCGGGPGVYALWLARLGYTVHLIDPVPVHIAQAHEASAAHRAAPLASCTVGDARRIALPDGSVDATLLFGPLYHLTERADRMTALREARRIVRQGGVVLAIGISCFISIRTVAIEGPARLIARVRDSWDDTERRTRALDALRATEDAPSLLGASQHLMVIARREAN
jgi:ubiquinone/menaquinone biosynthesis C-methylase UbiE